MQANRKILIHHHATIYIEPETGEMYTFSFIARWVNALTDHFDTVGLIMHTSNGKTSKHDTLLNKTNIRLFSLGKQGNTWDRFKRIKRIKAVCKGISAEFTYLLIRGITPRQFTIFKYVNVPHKFFLLVGSLIDSKPSFKWAPDELYAYVMYYLRKAELKTISKNAKVFANSPKVVTELDELLQIKAQYTPTSTIMTNELFPYRVKTLHNPVRLFFCGRVIRDKGIFELLEAVYQLNKMHQKYTLTITGDLNDKIKQQIFQLPYWQDIQAIVKFTGFISFGKTLLKLYDEHDIYVLPSYHEGFPHSIWEAAATSTTVITTAVGGIPGIVSDSEVSFVKVQSAESIVNIINYTYNNQHEMAGKTKACYDLVKENTVEKTVTMLNNYLNVERN